LLEASPPGGKVTVLERPPSAASSLSMDSGRSESSFDLTRRAPVLVTLSMTDVEFAGSSAQREKMTSFGETDKAEIEKVLVPKSGLKWTFIDSCVMFTRVYSVLTRIYRQ
jgi:hypothetical protein